MSRKTSDRGLNGKHVLVTRPENQAESFASRLRREGAVPVLLPTIATIAPDSWEAVDRAINSLTDYDGVIFTSVNGVRFFCRRLEELGHSLSRLPRQGIVSVGPKTAAALEKLGVESRITEEKLQGEGILEALAGTDIAGRRFLLPRAMQAREILPETLRQRGAVVDVVAAYQTIFPPASAAKVNKLFTNGQKLDILTFTSSSSVSILVEQLREPRAIGRLRRLPTACIGPITAATARRLGLNVQVEAGRYTVEDLIETMKKWLADR